MSVVYDRQLFFNPVTGELRFDFAYDIPDNIPDRISWPMDNQRNNRKYGFKNLTLALTMNCNLSCDYCWQQHGNVPDMEKQTIDHWLDFFLDPENNIPNKILYYGGEPLLRMDLIEYSSQKMKQLCKKRKIAPVKQHIFTNATLLTDTNLDILKKEGVFLILSIDGSPEVNAIHRHNSQDAALADQIAGGIRKLHSRNMRFGVCCTLSEADFDPDVTIRYILEEIRPNSIELNLRHDIAFCHEAEKYKGKLLPGFCKAWEFIRESGAANIDLQKRLVAIATRVPLQNSSSGSKNKLSVMPDGKISSYNGAVSYPELQIDPVGEWIEKFKARWSRNVLNNKECQHCQAAFICGQGSAFSSYLQYGDLQHAPALHCEYCKTMLDYILETIRKEMLHNKEVPYGYVVSYDDICSVFPGLFDRYESGIRDQ